MFKGTRFVPKHPGDKPKGGSDENDDADDADAEDADDADAEDEDVAEDEDDDEDVAEDADEDKAEKNGCGRARGYLADDGAT